MNKELLQQLRAQTHLGMSECRNALTEANDNYDQALEILKNKGLKKVDKLILPKEGIVKARCDEDYGIIVEVNCETDFASKSELFQNFVNNLDFLNTSPDQRSQELTLLSRQLGETVTIRRHYHEQYCRDSDYNRVVCYNHNNNKLAVLLFAYYKDSFQNKEALENVAMQIAANSPLFLSRNNLDNSLLEEKKKEFSVGLEKKAETIKEKIIQGKLNKWFSEVCLEDQKVIFIENSTQTISEYLASIDPEIKLESFVRYQLGEAYAC